MSYSLIGHFVDLKKKQIICTASLDFLKVFCESRLSCPDLGGITPKAHGTVEDAKAIFPREESKFLGSYDTAICEKEWFTGNNKFTWDIDDDTYEAHKQEIESFRTKDLSGFSAISIYKTEKGYEKGTWFCKDDFEELLRISNNEVADYTHRHASLSELRYTTDYFKLDDEAKDNYLSECTYIDESLDDAKFKVDCCQKMINVLDFLNEDMADTIKNEKGEPEYDWDLRNVEVYIIGC